MVFFVFRADFRKSCCLISKISSSYTSQLSSILSFEGHTSQLQGTKKDIGAYSLGVAAFFGLGVAFFLVAVLGFLGAAAFLGLAVFLVAVFLGA